MKTSFVKHDFNINEEIISNNMILFTTAIGKLIDNVDKHANGFLMLDIDNFNTPQHALIYNLIKSVTDKQNINLDDYFMVMRSCIKYGRDCFDMYADYGEYHDIITPSGTTVRDCCEFSADIYFNDSDDVITIATDLNKNNTDTIPQINEITLIRPRKMSALIGSHRGFYYLTDPDCCSRIKDGSRYETTIEFFNKKTGKLLNSYPNFSDVVKDETELYAMYERYYPFSKNKEKFVNNTEDITIEGIELVANTISNNSLSSSADVFLRNLLDSYHYTFETFYKSLYPGEYTEENFEIKHYDECFANDACTPIKDINNRFRHKCVGNQTVPVHTREIILEMCNYMKTNHYYSMTITQ
jgi:hypothetical protein